MKPLLAFALTFLSLTADTVTYSDNTGDLVTGSYRETLRLPAFHGGTLNSVTFWLNQELRIHPDGGAGGTITADVSLRGEGVDWAAQISTTVPAGQPPIQNGYLNSGFLVSFDESDHLADFVGHGDLRFKLRVTVVDQFGVPEDAATSLTVTYTYDQAPRSSFRR